MNLTGIIPGRSKIFGAQGLVLTLVLLLSSSVFFGCNRGLSPVQSSATVQSGFAGTVRFVSAWPPADSVQRLKVVALRNYPTQNIITIITSGKAEVYPSGLTSLPQFAQSTAYSFTLDSASTFRYIAVALQYGSNILQDWKVVGVYGYSHGVGQPDSVVVSPGTFINGIDIDVDFKNTPPNPLGGLAAPASRN